MCHFMTYVSNFLKGDLNLYKRAWSEILLLLVKKGFTVLPTGTQSSSTPSPQYAVIQRSHYDPAHSSWQCCLWWGQSQVFLKMQQQFHYLAYIKLSPKDLLLMLKCIDLFMKVCFCPFVAIDEASVSNGSKIRVEASLMSLIVCLHLVQAAVCDSGVQ